MTGEDETPRLQERLAKLRGVPVEVVRSERKAPCGPDHLPQDVEDWGVPFRRYRGIASDAFEKAMALDTGGKPEAAADLYLRCTLAAAVAELWRAP